MYESTQAFCEDKKAGCITFLSNNQVSWKGIKTATLFNIKENMYRPIYRVMLISHIRQKINLFDKLKKINL